MKTSDNVIRHGCFSNITGHRFSELSQGEKPPLPCRVLSYKFLGAARGVPSDLPWPTVYDISDLTSDNSTYQML